MDTLELAKKLITFKTTQDNPEVMRECLDFCVGYFDEYKPVVKKYECDGVPSVLVANSDGLDFDVLVLGHIDTVPGADEKFVPKEIDGKLYGRGSLDMKAFVATSMKVLENVFINKTPLKVGILIVTDEELGGKFGARYAVEDLGMKAGTVLVPDSGKDILNMTIKSKHALHIKVAAEGVESHGALPWAGKSAIEMLLQVVDRLREKFPYYSVDKAPDDTWVDTLNLGVIEGGTATNEVAGEASITLDFRLTDNMSKDELLKILNESMEDGVNYEIELEGYPTIVDKNDPVVKMYSDVISEKVGTVNYIMGHGATDGRYFANNGMRVIVHQGTGGGIQGEAEWVDINSLYQLIEVQSEFIKRLAIKNL